MSLALALILLAQLAPPSAVPPKVTEIRAQEREPLVLVVRGSDVRLGTSEVLHFASPILKRDTALELVTTERWGVDSQSLAQCGSARLGCWIRHIVGDGRGQEVPHVLLIAVDAREDYIELTAMYLPRQARDIDAVATDLEIQEWVLARALPLASCSLKVLDEATLSGCFEDIITRGRMRSTLESTAQWRPFGALELDVPDGLTIEIDGASVGATRGDRTHVTDLRPGERRVVLRNPRSLAVVHDALINIAENRQAHIAVTAPSAPRASDPYLLGAAAGAGALGVAAIVATLFDDAPTMVAGCVGGACGERDPRRFSRFCDLSSDRTCSGLGRIGMAPLGLSLLVSASVWSAGALFPEHFEPWQVVLAGVAGGLLMFATTTALD